MFNIIRDEVCNLSPDEVFKHWNMSNFSAWSALMWDTLDAVGLILKQDEESISKVCDFLHCHRIFVKIDLRGITFTHKASPQEVCNYTIPEYTQCGSGFYDRALVNQHLYDWGEVGSRLHMLVELLHKFIDDNEIRYYEPHGRGLPNSVPDTKSVGYIKDLIGRIGR